MRELFGKEPSRGVNPDEVVAMGAAIQVRAKKSYSQVSGACEHHGLTLSTHC